MAKNILKNTTISILAVVLLFNIIVSSLPRAGVNLSPQEGTDFEVDDLDSSAPLSAADIYNEIGLFDNFAPVYAFLLNNSLDEEEIYGLNGTVRHIMSPNGSEIVDNYRYALDNIEFYSQFRGRFTPEAVPGQIKKLQNTPLWSEEAGAFREYVDGTNTILSDRIPIEDNTLAILILQPFIANLTAETNAKAIISDIWGAINSTMWDPNLGIFLPENRTLPDASGVDVTGPLWGIIAACTLHQGENTGFREDLNVTDAFQKAESTMINLWSDIGAIAGYDHTNGGFNDQIWGDTGLVKFDQKLLKTNALAISALSKLYISSGRNFTYLDRAEETLDFILDHMKNSSWYDSYQVYVNATSSTGSINWGANPAITLEDSAYLMMALNDLYQISGNKSHLDLALNLSASIEDHLFDTPNLAYNSSVGFQKDNTNKNSGDMGLLFHAYKDLSDTGLTSSLSARTNASQYMRGESAIVNVSLQFNHSIYYNVSHVDNATWSFNSTIDRASTSYVVRYPNNTVLMTVSQTTDDNGEDEVIFEFPLQAPVGDYTIAIYANRTGYYPRLIILTINYWGGLELGEELEMDPVVQGESGELVLTIDSSRQQLFYSNISISGDGIYDTYKLETIKNETTTEITFQVTVNTKTKTGYTKINVDIYNDSLLYLSENFYLQVTPAIEVYSIEAPPQIANDETRIVNIFIKSHRTSADELVSVEVFGESFTGPEVYALIQAGNLQAVPVTLTPSRELPADDFNFGVNVTRANISYYEESVPISVKNPLEFKTLRTTNRALQDQNIHLTIEILNNLQTTQEIQILVNQKSYQEKYSIIPGDNKISIEISPLNRHLWDFGEKTVSVEILQDGRTYIKNQFTVVLEMTVQNIMWGIIIPIGLPVIIFVGYKQWEIKNEIFIRKRETK